MEIYIKLKRLCSLLLNNNGEILLGITLTTIIVGFISEYWSKNIGDYLLIVCLILGSLNGIITYYKAFILFKYKNQNRIMKREFIQDLCFASLFILGSLIMLL